MAREKKPCPSCPRCLLPYCYLIVYCPSPPPPPPLTGKLVPAGRYVWRPRAVPGRRPASWSRARTGCGWPRRRTFPAPAWTAAAGWTDSGGPRRRPPRTRSVRTGLPRTGYAGGGVVVRRRRRRRHRRRCRRPSMTWRMGETCAGRARRAYNARDPGTPPCRFRRYRRRVVVASTSENQSRRRVGGRYADTETSAHADRRAVPGRGARASPPGRIIRYQLLSLRFSGQWCKWVFTIAFEFAKTCRRVLPQTRMGRGSTLGETAFVNGPIVVEIEIAPRRKTVDI